MKAAEAICHPDLPEGLGKIRREKLTNTSLKKSSLKILCLHSLFLQRTVSRAPVGLHKARIIEFLNYSNIGKLLQLATLNKSDL